MTANDRNDTHVNDVVQGLLAEIAFAKLEKARQATRMGGPRRAPGTAPAAAALIDLREEPADEPPDDPGASHLSPDLAGPALDDTGEPLTPDHPVREDESHSVS
ncbi:MAG: hypothetical protein M5T61_06830 [Acidimicrobiia bacterium]|nr:hypothetical protein [Acidimicrobiia bacterium]